MPTLTLVSVDEYLSTSYDPDVEYVDGQLVERNVGEKDHGRLQTLIATYLANRETQWKICTYTDTRTQVLPTRFRLPDICVVPAPETDEQIIRTAPFLCIEILSKDDRAEDIQEKIEEYLAFGVKYVWIINHRKRLAYVHTSSGMTKAKDGVLKTSEPDIAVPLAEIWPKWKRP